MSKDNFGCCCPPSFALDAPCQNEINPDEFIKSLEIQFQDLEGFKTWYSIFKEHLLYSAQRNELAISGNMRDGFLEIETKSIYKRFEVYIKPI